MPRRIMKDGKENIIYDDGIPENQVPGTLSHINRGRTTKDSADVENGGNVPNMAIGWDRGAFDRFEGSIKGKNRLGNGGEFGSYVKNQTVKQNVPKPVRDF